MTTTSGTSMTHFCDALADEVLQNIHNREALIKRLEKLHRESVVSRESRIQRLLYGIHNASLAVVEAITAWNQCKQQAWYRKKTIELHNAALIPADGDSEHCAQRCPFNAFSFNGQNYMKKMLSDLDFVAEIPEALNFVGPSTSFHRNPFLLPMNIDELALCHRDKAHQTGVESKKISSIPWKDVNVQRVQHSSFIMLLDEFHRELGLLSDSPLGIDENDPLSAAYAANCCRNMLYFTKFFPPELNVDDLSDIINMLDPPATHVIAICCASLVLNCVDADIMNKLLFLTKPIAIKIFRQPLGPLITKARSYNPLQKIDLKVANIVYPFVMHQKMSSDALAGAPEPILFFTAWLRGVLSRTYDADSAISRSCNVDKVFSELDSASSRRNKTGGTNKMTSYLSDDSNKENDADTNQCRNASVQVQAEDFDESLMKEKDVTFDNLKSFKDLFDPEPIKLVPLPIPITITVIEGNQTAVVNGEFELANSIQSGDVVRICDPFESSDWNVKSSPCRDEDGTVSFELTAAYDHSKIVAQEKKTRDDAIYRLCYGRDRTPSPGRVLSSIGLNDVASDQHTSIRSRLHIKEVRVWKLITEDKDTRPPWRREYDNEMVPWVEDYADTNKYAKLFRVRVKMEEIEKSCRDSPYLDCVHQQRVKFFESVSLMKVIDEAFRAVCQWHPKGSLVDNVKWAKLSRKMKFMSNMKNAKHEIDMAFVRHNNDRKLDLARFHSILRDIASMQYPALHIDLALHKVVWASLVMLPDVNKMMWKEAKAMAVTLETRRVCAQIRIATLVRKQQQSSRYAIAKGAAVTIETYVRGLLARVLLARLMKARNDDATFKHQTQCSIVIQASWRRFFWRNRFTIHQEKRKEEARQRVAAVRAMLKYERDRLAASIVYRDVIRIDSTIAAVAIQFQDESAFQEDAVLVMKVYVPSTKETFTFRLDERMVRECLENALNSSSSLSWSEMLHVNALAELPKRLMLRVVRGRPIFLFSKRNIVEKGTLLRKVAILAAGDIFILSVFRSPHEIAFVTYQPSTCMSMRTKLTNAKLTEWLRESLPPPGYQCDDRIDFSTEGMLHLLKSKRQKDLLDWLVKRIVIRKHPKEPHSMQLLLQFEAEEERILKLVTKVQSQWRRLRTQRRAKEQTFAQYEKIYNREYNMYAYRNVNTDERQWEKPKLLGADDLTNPVDEWREVETEDGRKYYVNYGTGQSSWLSEQDAARLVQRRYRSKHESDLLGAKIHFPDIVKAMKFIHGARVKYEQEPSKLPNLVNYAMLCHCLDLDFENAKPIYEKAMKQSPNHPLISRAYGIFLLASCQPTQAMSFQAATRLFREANVSDPHQTMIRSAAEIYFRWAVLGNAKNPLALLNYALLHQCIYNEYEHAEKIYRAALAIDPTNQFVTDNYSLFLQERYPGGAYESAGPPFSVVRRSEVIEERPEYGEWSKLMDPMCPKKGFELYWYNRFTKVTQFAEPDWNEVWAVRVRRSKVIPGKMTSFSEYYDPRLNQSFFLNHSTSAYCCAIV